MLWLEVIIVIFFALDLLILLWVGVDAWRAHGFDMAGGAVRG